MKTKLLLAFLFALLGFKTASAQNTARPQQILSEMEAKTIVDSILKKSPIIDGHNDLFIHYFDCKNCPIGLDDYPLDSITSGHTDIPRWRKGGVGGQLLNVFGRELTTDSYLQAWDLLYEMEKKYPSDLKMVGSASEMRSVMKQGKIAILPTLEGAKRIQDNPLYLRMYYELGLRAVTFAYKTNKLADGSDDDPQHNGISDQGVVMLNEMNRLGILIDMSHISEKAMSDILDVSKSPVIFTHSNAKALCDVNRNVSDVILKRLQKNRGLVMISVVPDFTKKEFYDWYEKGDAVYIEAQEKYPEDPEKVSENMDEWAKNNTSPVVTIEDLANHFDYVKTLIGVDYIGIGGDYDGIDFTIQGMEDVSTYPKLLIELVRRGWTASELKKITSENFLRVFEEVEKIAKKLKS